MKRILVVDDDMNVRTAIVCTLEDEGYEVIETDNGASAFDLATAERPDLIITDVMMDSGNGFALRELLTKDSRTTPIKVIMMTGAAHHAGAWQSNPNDRYLLKPFSATALLTEVKSILAGS